jgi:RHS repeat-associated protein
MLITVNDLYELKINANGTEEATTYYRANNEMVAKKVGTTLTYHHNDHLNSASIVTNTTGGLVEETRYLPYGEVRSGGSENLTGRYTYTDQESDNETGLMYYGARYYAPSIGRFVQPDSMLPDMYDPQEINRYAYVKNNPLKYTDPTGHYSSDPNDYPFLYTNIKDPNIRKQLILNWIATQRSLDYEAGLETAGNIARGVSEALGCTAVDLCDFYELATGQSVWGEGLTDDELGTTASLLMVPVGSSALARNSDDVVEGAMKGLRRGAKILNPKMYKSVAKRIAYGHALTKHITEFKTIKNGSALANLTEFVMKNFDLHTKLKNGREVWFNKKYNTIVVYDPNHKHRGTVFKGSEARYNEIVSKDAK